MHGRRDGCSRISRPGYYEAIVIVRGGERGALETGKGYASRGRILRERRGGTKVDAREAPRGTIIVCVLLEGTMSLCDV